MPYGFNEDKSKYEFASDKSVILIGDSYLGGTHSASASTDGTNWGAEMQALCNFDTVRSYVNGGAGFCVGGSASQFSGLNFGQMVPVIAAQLTDSERDAVTDVVFGGGWNDGNHVSDWNGSLVTSAVAAARASFPNANISIVYMYGGSKPAGTNWLAMESFYRNAAYSNACAYASTVTLVNNFGTPSYDGIHPTNSVQKFLGGLVGALINGGVDGIVAQASGMRLNTLSNGISVQNSKYGVAVVNGSGTKVPSAYTTGGSNKVLGNIGGLAPMQASVWAFGVCSSPFTWVLILIETNGDVKLQYSPINLAANSNLYFTITYPIE